ncbi:MAG: AAA domain-containing protein [Promethearchaeota archaeon]
MSSISDSWKSRYIIKSEILEELPLPFSDKIRIQQFIAKDLAFQQEVVFKKIFVNEHSNMGDLAQYLWHYEISLNQRAFNIAEGKTLIKLIDGGYDPEEKCFFLVNELCGMNLKDILSSECDHEDIDSFKELKKSSFSKKKVWAGILKIAEGLRALHNTGLLHRNISLNTIYFNGDAYREGEPYIFKLGDFNWSIYLYSICNLVSGDIPKGIIQDNLHFFRAPECLEMETFKSDIFSLGLVIAFLIFELDINKYVNSDFSERLKLYEQLREKIEFEPAIEKEKEIILKAIELNPDHRFDSTEDFTESIREFVNELNFNHTYQKKLPIYFKLERDSYFLIKIARKIDVNIQGIRSQPNEFLKNELHDCILFLTKNKDWPLWTMGKNGKYKFRRAHKNRKLAEITYLKKHEEREFGLTDHKVCTVGEFYWYDYKEKAYSIWDQILANSLTQIRTLDIRPSEYELQKYNWLKALKYITEAEEEIERRNIFEYEIIEDSNQKKEEKKEKRQLIINVFNDLEREPFSEVLRNSQKKSIELSNLPDLHQKFKEKRKWRVIEVIDEHDDINTIIKLEESRKNEEPPMSGYLRFWDLRSTLFLLKRKYSIIQNLEEHTYLIDAILNPAVTHQYFIKDNKTDIVKFIFYTFPIFLLQGPPGTGKTWTAKELIKLSLIKDPYKRILVSSKEHAALDDLLRKTYEMCEGLNITPKPILVRLISPERERDYPPTSIAFQHFPKQISLKMLDNISEWVPKDDIHNNLIGEIKSLLEYEKQAPSREWVEIIRESSNLVFCTSTANDLRELEFSRPSFDLVIVEEAGKTYPSELFRPLELGNKWVLIGDQNQLPPFRLNDIKQILNERLDKIESEKQDEQDFNESEFLNFRKLVLKELKIFQSMFERFKEVTPSYDIKDERKSCDTLINQYRLPSKISGMISNTFYDKEFNQMLKDFNDFIIEPLEFKREQLIWINTKGDRRYREQRKGTDLYNVGEVRLILEILKKIKILERYKDFSLAILTPYKEQVDVLKTYLPQNLSNLGRIKLKESCYTIDSFQGQEADLIIISMVRSNNKESPRVAWGFIPKTERLNVMLSRAKKVEIIIGDLEMCIRHKKHPDMEKFYKIAKFIQEEGKIIEFEKVTS